MKIVISRSQWEAIGKQAGWARTPYFSSTEDEEAFWKGIANHFRSEYGDDEDAMELHDDDDGQKMMQKLQDDGKLDKVGDYIAYWAEYESIEEEEERLHRIRQEFEDKRNKAIEDARKLSETQEVAGSPMVEISVLSGGNFGDLTLKQQNVNAVDALLIHKCMADKYGAFDTNFDTPIMAPKYDAASKTALTYGRTRNLRLNHKGISSDQFAAELSKAVNKPVTVDFVENMAMPLDATALDLTDPKAILKFEFPNARHPQIDAAIAKASDKVLSKVPVERPELPAYEDSNDWTIARCQAPALTGAIRRI